MTQSLKLARALLLIAMWSASGSAADAGTNDDRRSRAARLQESLLAPCCYKEPVARHQSEIAVKMRLEIQNWLDVGKTDDEILEVYKARYGAQVLSPPHSELWFWSDGIPWSITVLSAAGVVWLIARWHSRSERLALPPEGVDLPPVPESEEDEPQN